MQKFEQFATHFGEWIWSLPLFLLLLGCGVVFSVLTKFVQYRVMTHGISVIRGKYDRPEDAGQINHFQALCAALSATIGLGNIAGVALAVQLGGPGAIFWMWVVGLFGMAIKFVECGLATMFRDEKDVPDLGAPALLARDAENHTLEYEGEEPPAPGAPSRGRGEVSGGPMWYIQKGLAEPARARGNSLLYGLFRTMAVMFAVGTFFASFGGGNSFQAWNVAEMLQTQFHIDTTISGGVMAFLVALVIIGGIRRIGQVASKLVPFMCIVYVLGALYIIAINSADIPRILSLIVNSAFAPAPAGGAFLGSTFAVAFNMGLRRALFSNEAGQGSAAIAHAAAKTNEPVREGLVAGIGPFIDTLIICTMTAFVILVGGVHDRPAVGAVKRVTEDRIYVRINEDVPEKLQRVYANELNLGAQVDVWTGKQVYKQGEEPESLDFRVKSKANLGPAVSNWLGAEELVLSTGDRSPEQLAKVAPGAVVHLRLDGATMTRFAFDTCIPGFGSIMVTAGVVLFAFSTMISWSYYGEKGAEFLFGPRMILPYKFLFITVIFLASIVKEFSIVYNMSDALVGAMALVNLPAALLLLPRYLRATRNYFRRLDSGQMPKLR